MQEEIATADLLKGLYAALGRRELEAAMLSVAGDAAIEEVNRSNRVALRPGRDGLLELLGRYHDQFREFRMEPHEVRDGPGKTLVSLTIGGIGISGAELWGTVYHVHTIAAGRSQRIEVYLDRDAAAKAAGLDGLISELSTELHPGGDLELAVDAPEMGLDRLLGHE
jgi:ketosteroid isomerase-like protein